MLEKLPTYKRQADGAYRFNLKGLGMGMMNWFLAGEPIKLGRVWSTMPEERWVVSGNKAYKVNKLHRNVKSGDLVVIIGRDR